MRVAHGAGAVGPPRRRSHTTGDDIGVHLTLNAEHDTYRWGPITHAPSLLSGEGGFPRTSTTCGSTPTRPRCSASAAPRSSGRIAWGIDVTHLAPHLTAITLRPEFFDVYLELAVEFRLPIRLPSTITAEQAGFPFRQLAADEGVRVPRPLRPRLARRQPRAGLRRASPTLQPGVTEMHVQPAIDTPEVRALTPSAEHGSTTSTWSPTTRSSRELIAPSGAVLIGYARLRDGDASRLTASPTSTVAQHRRTADRCGRRP